MKSNLLTKEYLPDFIYLTDQILTYSFTSEEAEFDNIYKIISVKGVGLYNETISDRTIRRAFNLRENLRAGAIIRKDYNRPEIKTLNVLTYYFFEKKKPTRFKVLGKIYQEEIEKHYKDNKPSDEIIAFIFDDTPEKVKFINKKKKDIENLLDKITEEKFENLSNELIKANERFSEFQKKVNDDLKIQNELIEHLKIQLEQVKKERKRATFFYRIFGSIGLFFAPINYNEVNLTNVLDDMIDEYEGVGNDDLIDDIL